MEMVDSYWKYNIFKRLKYRGVRNNFFYLDKIVVKGSKFIVPFKSNVEFKKGDLIMTYCVKCRSYEIMRLY